ncbi:hypothetical protein XENORESO_016637, partial [Xenotaenia resolanae]
AAIFTGLQMMDSTTNLWLMKVMGGFAGWEALFYGLLELQGRLKLSRADDSHLLEKKQIRADVLLMLYLLGNISFLVALIVGIGKMP